MAGLIGFPSMPNQRDELAVGLELKNLISKYIIRPTRSTDVIGFKKVTYHFIILNVSSLTAYTLI
jgi:hypothetical protein